MMSRLLFTGLLIVINVFFTQAQTQQGITQCGTPTHQVKFPLSDYQELPDHASPNKTDWATTGKINVSWGTTNRRYAKHALPLKSKQEVTTITGWRGECLNAQAVVWTREGIEALTAELTTFSNAKGEMIPAEAFEIGFVRYVMTDELNKGGKGGCGYRPDHSKFDSLLVADPIDFSLKSMALEPYSTRPIWVKCRIPMETLAGLYKGKVIIKEGHRVVRSLDLKIKVLPRVLPQPKDWAFHLDLWQNPFAVARYHQVPLWSDAHFEAMRPLMKMLAEAGQKVITASIMHKPWNAQTEDYYETMVTWMKRADGTWAFDYTIFDRWVEFMMEQGIDRQINCYSMVPWKLSFRYYDQVSDQMQVIKAAPGEKAYEELWIPMLKSFAAHLKEKGWFDRCTIAMDERPMDVMQKTLAVIRKADPEFKISLAGNYHQAIEKEIYDYCITIGQDFPLDVRQRRLEEGKPTTFYTCCTESFPNTFTFSDPAEAAWIGYYCAKKELDGYLRWAYNSWPLEPLLDSRFSAWAGGDTYLVYPGARTSIRFEKLLEGIQAHEKISLLRKEFEKKGDAFRQKRLERLLSPFDLFDYDIKAPSKTIDEALKKLNQF